MQVAACGRAAPVNEALRPLFHLLRALADAQPAALGASVLGLSEVHGRWRHFVGGWRALAPHARLHFCSTDIAQCYDTIDQARLLATLGGALRAHGASVQRHYALLAPCQERLAARSVCVAQHGLGVAAPLARVAARRPASLLVDRQFHTSLAPSAALQVRCLPPYPPEPEQMAR